jgi:hypothetical protein
MDHSAYTAIIKSVCARLGGINPNETIVRNVIAHCKRLDIEQLRDIHGEDNDLMIAIAESYIDTLKKDEPFNYNDHLQRSKDKNIKVTTTWLEEQMPTITSKSMSILVDSRLRRVDSSNTTSITSFAFTIVPQNRHTQIGDGDLQVRIMPSQITYFRINRIVIPYSLALRSCNYSNELTMIFTALRSNGIISNDDTYHFVFTYTPINDFLVQLTPIDKYCKFSPPLRTIDDLSIRFNDPIVPIAFAMDRMYASSISYLNADGRITFSTAHGLSIGDVVIISGLTTLNDAANAAILSTIMNPRGIVIGIVNTTVISIGVDLTAIVSPDINSKPLVLFQSKTFRFPMEIGYQDVVDAD